ncbi:MAG: hydrogenase small subunit [Dehalococcoidia bacterium]|nr:hydrogenase small subunit [Dehalococcoidia bacterium]
MRDFLFPTIELTRRDFLKVAGGAAALLGLSQALTPQMAKALEESIGKPAVIWLEGQDCTGCSESFVNSLEPVTTSILLNSISLRYHETLMAASGYHAEGARQETIKQEKGKYILVIEGSIPLAEDGKYCVIAGAPFKEIVRETAADAAAIICVGSCATYGGIPRSGPTDAVGYLFRGTQKHHEYDDVTGNKPVVNLPTCPVHPERLVATIVHYLTFGTIPPLDHFLRPKAFYGFNQHDNCERRGQFEAGRFVTDWGDPSQQGYCLYMKGCRGPVANQDCWKRRWNQRTNYCIKANTPCVACSEPEFFEWFSPVYERQYDISVPGIGRVDIDKVAASVAGATAAGIGVHMLASHIKGKRDDSSADTEPKTEAKES